MPLIYDPIKDICIYKTTGTKCYCGEFLSVLGYVHCNLCHKDFKLNKDHYCSKLTKIKEDIKEAMKDNG